MPRVTMKTVADRVGVSAMTVSNAFNRPDQLSAALREKILAAAADLGYLGPDPTARALASGSTGTVGILLTDVVADAFEDEMSTSFLGAVASAMTATGLGLTLLPGTSAGDEVLPARDVAMDGAFVYSCRSDSSSLSWLRRRGLPLVNIDRDPEPGVPGVNVADRDGARSAARHVVDLGHRRVGLVLVASELGPDGTLRTGEEHAGFAARERLHGWSEVVREAGGTVTPVWRTGTTPEDGYAAARDLLAADPRPTAILCFSDAMASGVLTAAADLGLDVPRELSVVGFDDMPMARRVRPALTTVRQDVTAKGRAAVDAMIATLGSRGRRASDGPPDGDLHEVPHVVLPTTLVVRDSTAPPQGRDPGRTG